MTRQRIRAWKRQSGIALVALLVLLIMAGAYAFYRSANFNFGRSQQDQKLQLRLAQAKEALIAYAVTDNKRPGRLLCPDLIGDGVSPVLSRDDCDAYIGWLPWKTLDIGDATDDHGTKLRYVVLRWFGGDRPKPPLNSDTLSTTQLTDAGILATSLESTSLGTLYLDTVFDSGTNAIDPLKNDTVALIIAPRGELDARNADRDNYFYSHSYQPNNPGDNDVIMPVTRQELMAAVEKRIAAELKNCLEQHAQHPSNSGATYPWPAPLSNAIFKGQAGSLFGMVPDTQPGNPDETLKASLNQLQNAKNALGSASTAEAQVDALGAVEQAARYAGGLADRIYIVAKRLADAAEAATRVANGTVEDSKFITLKKTLSALTTTKEVYDAGKATLPGAVAAALPELATFRDALADSGFDVFLVELEKQNASLKTRLDAAAANPTLSTLGALQTQANEVRRNVLGSAYTPDPALAALLADAYARAEQAVDAARIAKGTLSDRALIDLALLRATDLYGANITLAATLRVSRLTLDPGEITYFQRILRTALDDFLSQPGSSGAAILVQNLNGARTLVASLAGGSPTVRSARDSALGALDSALAANTEPLDTRLITGRSEAAITVLGALANAMRNNGDNFVLETLKNIETTLGAVTSPPSTRTAANALRTPIDDVLDWAGIALAYAEDVARKARKGVGAADDSDTSVYSAARKTVSSIDGGTGSIELLQDFIKDSGNDTKRLKAQDALAKTLDEVSTLLDTGRQLETMLETSLAQAGTPTVWLGEACAFLQPPLNVTLSYRWHDNLWKNFMFYQISGRVRPATGKLSVNGSGSYRVVIVSAGAKLPTQDRSVREARSFLEAANIGYNAISGRFTRDGDATTPDTSFASGPPLDTFNDRLAY